MLPSKLATFSGCESRISGNTKRSLGKIEGKHLIRIPGNHTLSWMKNEEIKKDNQVIIL
jgi:hypothetical protein